MKSLAAALCAVFLAACSIGPTTRDVPAVFDFGPAATTAVAQPRIHASVLLYDVGAAPWLDTQDIVYKLNYTDAARQQSYTASRWAAPPAKLLTQRLRASLSAVSDAGVVTPADAARADYGLRVEIDDFSQVFDSVDSSRAVLIAHASLIESATRKLQAQTQFKIELSNAGANAASGVKVLATAAAQLAAAVTDWTAANTQRKTEAK